MVEFRKIKENDVLFYVDKDKYKVEKDIVSGTGDIGHHNSMDVVYLKNKNGYLRDYQLFKTKEEATNDLKSYIISVEKRYKEEQKVLNKKIEQLKNIKDNLNKENSYTKEVSDENNLNPNY